MAAIKKPIKFKRMADDLFEEPQSSSSSSGSDHFPSGSLSDLVNSFIQKVDDDDDNPDTDGDGDLGLHHSPNSSGGAQRKELLIKLLASDDEKSFDNDVRRKLIQEIEVGFGDLISTNPKDSGFKRQLMVRLRGRGYDAGLCKSRWEKTGRYPAGSYEYVDIISEGRRYIVEVNPAAELEIARPTEQYTELMEELPTIFIGEPEKLKKMVRLMSAAIKESLKTRDLEVAPWRRNAYLQAQWFAPYKRTTNAAASSPASASPSVNNSSKIRRTVVGFPKEQGLVFVNCRHEFSTKGGIRTGLLAASLQGKS